MNKILNILSHKSGVPMKQAGVRFLILRAKKLGILVLVLAVFNNIFVQAAIITSTGTGGTWSSNTTWSGGVVPGATDDVVIATGATIILDANFTTSASLSLNGTGTLQLAGFNLTTGSIISAGGSIINNSGAAINITTGSLNTNSTCAGIITGTIALTKIGTGSLTLSGNNTYSGTTTLSAGTININNATAIGSGTFTISAGATTIDNTSGVPITLINNNPQNWNGNFNFTGTQNLNLGTGTITMNSNCQITISTAAKILTIGGIISGASYNLTKAGPGTLTMGSNTVTINGLTINAGILTAPSTSLNIAGDFNNTGTFTHNSGTVNYNGVGTQAIAGVVYNNLTVSNGGSKILQAPTTVIGTLNLSSGVVQLGSNNLTFSGITGIPAITGVGSSSNMIETDGTGLLSFSNALLPGTVLNGTYPLGNNGDYNPLIINNLTGAGANRTINIRIITGQPFVNGINRYWEISHSGAALTGTPSLSFKYNASEASSDYTKYQPYTNVTGTWALAPSASAQGINPVTSTTVTVLPAISLWTVATPGALYSYQSGAWGSSATWTTDPGGTTYANPLNAVPGYLDMVYILAGRTVNLATDVATSGLDVTINEGGFLDLSSSQFTSGLFALRGQGTLKISPSNPGTGYFPAAITNTLINAGGGTTEYNVTTILPALPLTYNNLTINTSGTVTLVSNISLNGDLSVKQGTFQINDVTATRRQLTINGDVTVYNGASMTVGTGNTVTGADAPLTVPVGGVAPFTNYYSNETHRIIIFGDFTNNGTVRFTNQAYPQYNAFPNNGAATVYFQGSTNNTLTCNSQTDFYNLVLDKGNDQTFSLKVYSSGFTNFRLFGANTALIESAVANPNIRKALWIRNGTLYLTGLTVIPSLTEGSTGAITAIPTSDYFIPSNSAMILDGPFVTVLGTADDYTEVNAAYGIAGGNNVLYGINTSGAGSGLSILGNLQVNNGYLSTRESSGILYWSYAPGQFIMNGGTVDTKQFHNPEGGNTGLISYAQTGGNIIFRGRFQNTINYPTFASLSSPAINTARAANGTDGTGGIGTLSINNNAANGFTMSGGTISMYDVCGTTVSSYALYVGCPTSNINVTGGSVQLNPTTGTNLADAPYLINSLAPFGNLTINRISGISIVQLNTNPISILKNLNIQSGVFDANSLDVNISGNFTISNGSTYSTGTNNTVFNGLGTQTFTVNTATALSLSTLKENKSATDALVFAGGQSTINIVNLSILGGKFGDNGNTINVTGNVLNAGVHYGTGRIAMVGTNPQTIDGNGTFQNLELNNTNGAASSSPVSLVANTSINGTLTFSQDRLFNISTFNLQINASASIVNANANRYIQTAGNSGDGGVTKVYSSTTAFQFPIGAPTLPPTARPVKYTPATIGFSSAPTTFGSITVIPAGYEHPSTTVNNQSLTYFWRIKSLGFIGIPANSVTHTFVYDQTDVVGTEANYIPSIYNRTTYTWNNGTTANPPINTASNTITDWAAPTNSKAFLDADYTAGDNTTGGGAFGSPKKFYSIASSAWNINTTWSYTSGGVAVPAGAVAGVNFPGPNSIVIIENNKTVNLNANQSCASLQIQAGSTLDIYTWTGSVFSMVLNHPSGNNGLFRLTTTVGSPKLFSFPLNSDFSDFNANHGTTEYYDIDGATGAEYILPANVTSYGNLILTAKGGDNLILPNNSSTTIYGDLTCGGDMPTAWVTMSWLTGGVYTPVLEKTIHITGNMYINNGTFLFLDDQTPQHLIVDGNVTIAPTAVFDTYNNYPVNNGGAVRLNSFNIGGSFINNSNVNPSARFINGNNYVNLSFFGNSNASITSTGGAIPVTIFNNVMINKGSSQSTTLTCNIGGTLTTPVDNWLTMQNGTLIYNSPTNLNISTITPFTIPASSGLTINTASNINIAQGNVSTNTFYLNGKLTLTNGTINVGLATNNQHNDIEYSSGGASTIEVDGGSLIVNGAIRRNPSNDAGILNYTQTGSSVVKINGNSALNTNAKLEVLNNGSQFNMSGTSTLTIVRGGGGNSFGDLYLRPQTSSVTGTSAIIFSQGALAAQNYQMDANVPLNNLTITGAAGNIAKVTLMVSPLVINGNLTINSNSTLDANVALNIPVTINGNYMNSGTYIPQKNLTTFNGNTQSITGTTTPNIFYDLNVSPLTSLTLNPVNGNITVSDNLTIGSGTLACGVFKVNLSGNFTNNGNYTDNNVLGNGISLIGASSQHVAGSGTFSWLELNNPAGAILDNSIALNEHLTLTLGIFNIKQNLLTLQQNSTIDANGSPFSATKMVTTDGVMGNIGIRKFFTTSAQTFTYPIGTSGKYTPAILNLITSGYVGSIRINNVNTTLPVVLDPTNALKYYWDVESSGISGFTGDLTLKYLTSDVVGGPEISYQSAWLINPGASLSITGGVTPSPTSQIKFNYPAGTENLSGEYTAGLSSAFPLNVPTYISIKDGKWNDPTVWTQTAGTPHTLTTGPNGFIVIVNNNDTAYTNYCSAYQTTINGRLVINAGTYGHNFGTVTGNGTLSLQSGTFPAGVFTSFLDCSNNSTIEYGGAGSYSIIADLYDHLPNLLFSGTGTRILPDKDLTICNSLKINGPIVDNSVYNRHLTILGTMERYNTGIFNSGSGNNAIVSFSGSSSQTIGGVTGDFTGASVFNNLEINNTSGLIINPNGAIEVNGNLMLSNGLINTSTPANSKLTITNTAINCVIPSGGSASSYVNGPLTKKINQGDNFSFPIGQGNLPGNRISVSSTQTGPLFWTAQYINPNGTSNSYAAPLAAVSWNEYWSVTASSPSQAIINLGYYPNSDITPLVSQNGLTDLRVATYNASQWNAIASTGTGDNYNGTVSTSAIVSISAMPSNYTLATVTTVIPKAKFSPTTSGCTSNGIPVTFSAPTTPTFNYILSYSINGTAQAPITITPAMVPYTLPAVFAGTSAIYSLTGYTYNNGAGTGVVDGSPVTIYANPSPNANAGTNQSQCGITSVTLGGNTPVLGIGQWSIIGGAGGSLLAPNSPTSQFNGILPNSYTLQWTISNGTCKSSSNVSIAFTTRPSPPSALSPQNFCNAATIGNIAVTAPTGFVNWYKTSTYPPIPADFLPNTTNLTSGTTYYADAVSGTCISASPLTVVSVTVNPLPAAITGNSNVCAGSTTTLSDITAGGTWSSATPAVATISAGGVVSGLTAGTSVISYTLITGCAVTITITVNPLPAAITGTLNACVGAATTLADFTSSGTWSSATPSVATIIAGGTVTGITAGTSVISYTLGTGCATNTSVTINPLPATGPVYRKPNN